MKDQWETGDPYEYFMGRWSRLVAISFVEWLSPVSGLRWLDVGCGTGALSDAVANSADPSELIAIDQSEGFVNAAQQRLGERGQCRVGDALDLQQDSNTFDMAISGLVLNFIPTPEKALAEMRRVTRPGGRVAVYIWDYSGTMDFLNHFWDAVVDLDLQASSLHEASRFPDANAEGLINIFDHTGFKNTMVQPLTIETKFKNFDDYWKPFLGGQGPAPTYVLSLEETAQNNLRDLLEQRLPTQPDGSISLLARAWAASSEVL